MKGAERIKEVWLGERQMKKVQTECGERIFRKEIICRLIFLLIFNIVIIVVI
jgi:hypothetical protein